MITKIILFAVLFLLGNQQASAKEKLTPRILFLEENDQTAGYGVYEDTSHSLDKSFLDIVPADLVNFTIVANQKFLEKKTTLPRLIVHFDSVLTLVKKNTGNFVVFGRRDKKIFQISSKRKIDENEHMSSWLSAHLAWDGVVIGQTKNLLEVGMINPDAAKKGLNAVLLRNSHSKTSLGGSKHDGYGLLVLKSLNENIATFKLLYSDGKNKTIKRGTKIRLER